MIKLLLLPVAILISIFKLSFYLFYIFIKVIIIIFECIINHILGLFTNNKKHHKEIYITKARKDNSKNKESTKSYKDIEFDKEAELWRLSKIDKRIVKEERMSPTDYIEAEEYDDDNLDTDH